MDGSTGVWILGGHQSNFARNLSKENRDFAALTAEVVEGTLASAKVDAAGDYPSRGCAHLRHPEFRRQHRDHRQFRCQ
jgi:acetyl-CoA C-acetyltransferase